MTSWSKNKLLALTVKALAQKTHTTLSHAMNAQDKGELPEELSLEAAITTCTLKFARDAREKERLLVENATYAMHRRLFQVFSNSH